MGFLIYYKVVKHSPFRNSYRNERLSFLEYFVKGVVSVSEGGWFLGWGMGLDGLQLER